MNILHPYMNILYPYMNILYPDNPIELFFHRTLINQNVLQYSGQHGLFGA